MQQWTLGASTHGNRARSESELAPQSPQQVQRPTKRYWKASWGGGNWLWLTGGARTLTEEAAENVLITIILFLFALFCSVVGVVALFFYLFFLIFIYFYF